MKTVYDFSVKDRQGNEVNLSAYQGKILLIVNASLADTETGYKRALMELESLRRLILNGEKKEEPGGHMTGEVQALFSRETYCGMVDKAKKHIREGDIFQIVL